MLKEKNKFISNIIFSLIFLISIFYSSLLYIKGDNFEISRNSITPIDVFMYSPQNDEIGVSIITSFSNNKNLKHILNKELFSSNNNLEFLNLESKLRGFTFRSATYNFNYYGDINELSIDNNNFKDYLWKTYKRQFQLEIDSVNTMSDIQKKNYNKIIVDSNSNEAGIINNFSDYDIKSCKFNLVLDKFDTTDMQAKKKELDYICDIAVSKKYINDQENFFQLIKFEVFQRDTLSFMSSKKYNFKYITFSFITFISFIFLILINIRRKNL